jgi:uncharacterized repeat protein (TIGR03803 family)
VIHSFGNGKDGFWPFSALITDAVGNLYGTTEEGGIYGYGIVFELSPQKNGRWRETVLHNFNGLDGANPAAGLVMDTEGNLYGTTMNGGASDYGVVFEVTP